MTRGPLLGGFDTRQRQIIFALLLFLIGLIVGLAINWGRLQTDGARSVSEEYVAMVANLYQREHLVENAQQRLALLGSEDVVAEVSTIATEFPEKYPRRQQTSSNVQSLAKVLKENGAGQPATSGPPPAQSDSGGIGWLPLAFIVLVVLGVGGGAYYLRVLPARRGAAPRPPRFAGAFVNAGRRGATAAHWRPLPDEDEEESQSGVMSTPKPLTREGTSDPRPLTSEGVSERRPLTGEGVSEPRPMPKGWTPTSRSLPGEVFAAKTPSNGEAISAPRPYTPPSPDDEPKTRKTTPTKERGADAEIVDIPPLDKGGSSALRTRPLPRRGIAGSAQMYTCRYRVGEDPYDQLHSVVDPGTRVPIGACGVSSALTLNEGGGECFGFTLWLQDYAGADEMCNVGLASKWAEGNRSGALHIWASREGLRETVTASEGLIVALETSNLRAEARLTDFDYLEGDDLPRYACFGRLHITFSVASKGHS